MKQGLLDRAQKEVARTDLLDLCIKVSNDTFGWFTERYPRVFEYTWLLSQVEDMPDGYMCDVGAGVSPLPLILQKWGHELYTVDSYTPSQANEWGFVDYGKLAPNITSLNMDFAKFDMAKDFDVVYSISAIEHMRAQKRRDVFKRIHSVLRDGGVFLATMDIKRGTQQIYNRSGGVFIEDGHGSVTTVGDELESIFDYVWLGRQDGIKGVGTDLLYIRCEK